MNVTNVVKGTNDGQAIVSLENGQTVNMMNVAVSIIVHSDLIYITDIVNKRTFTLDFDAATLNKQGQMTAQALVNFWADNNFFFRLGAGGGLTGIIAINENHVFPTFAARDEYFDPTLPMGAPTDNTAELIENRTLILITDELVSGQPANQIQVWEGTTDPVTYDNTLWEAFGTDARANWNQTDPQQLDFIRNKPTTITPTQSARVNELDGITDDVIPIKRTAGYQDSALSETVDRVVSTKSIEAPPGSLFIGSGVRLSSGLKDVILREAGGTQRSILLKVNFSNTGSVAPTFSSLAAESPLILTNVFSATLDAITNPIVITFPAATSDRMVVGFRFRPASAGTLVAEAFTGADVNGDLVVMEEFTVEAGDLGNEIEMNIPSPLVTRTGDQFTLRVSGINVFGGVQTTSFFSGQNIPFVNFIVQDITEVDIVTDNNLLAKGTALGFLSAGGGTAFLTATVVPVGVSAGVWEPPVFNSRNLLADNTVTNINATGSITFGEDTFFAITNENTVDIILDISAVSGATFSGLGSGQQYTIPAGNVVIFYHDVGAIYPIAEYDQDSPAPSANQAVIVTRDTPSQADLTNVAAASVGGNSGLWVVANDQIAATESAVPAAIQIRALKSGQLDINNSEISTAAVNKSTVVLLAGTIVRVFSGTDLRIVSTPAQMRGERYPVLIVTSQVTINSQVLYNIYRNRTAVLNAGSAGTTEFRLPSLQNVDSLAYVNRNDVFCFRNDATAAHTFRIRTFQVGTIFSSNSSTILDVAPGQLLCITPAPSGAVWTVIQFGQSADIDVESLFLSEWYRDGVNALAADAVVRLHHKREIVDGDIRNHIHAVSSVNNPITLQFESRNIQDDIAWINWWSVWDTSVPPLSTGVIEALVADVQTALTYIQSNINNGFNFQFDDPLLGLVPITSISNIGGTTMRVNFATPLPAHIAVNDNMTIQNSSFAGNNGTWSIDAIAGDRLAFDITIPGSSAANNTGAAGFFTQVIFAQAVLVAHDIRQVNFNVYSDAGRTVLITTFPSEWFDPDLSATTTIFAIAYNNDLQTTGSQIAIQDDTDDFFVIKGGPRRSVTLIDNTLGNYQNLRTLPVNFEDIEIRTDGTADFLIPEYPDQLDIGEARRYFIHSHPLNDDDDVQVYIGDSIANSIASDEGLASIDIREGSFVELELYNNGLRSGWRIMNPINKTVTSGLSFPTGALASTTQIAPLPISAGNIFTAQSEDPNRVFFNYSNNRVVCRVAADYDFRLSVEVLFTGTQPSGVLFVPIGLNTKLNGVVQTRLSSNNQTLLLARYTAANASVVHAAVTLEVDIVDYQASPGDEFEWDLSFGSLPPGITLADFTVKDYVFTFTAKLRLD